MPVESMPRPILNRIMKLSSSMPNSIDGTCPTKHISNTDQSATTSATKSNPIHLQFAIHQPPQQCILQFSDVPPQSIICARRARSRTNEKYRPLCFCYAPSNNILRISDASKSSLMKVFIVKFPINFSLQQ
jgi:hypothetical protein